MCHPPQTEPLPTDIPTGIWFHSNACFSFNLPDDMPLESICLEGLCGEAGGDDVVRTRVGGDSVSAGLPDTSCEIVTLRVWCAVPVHDKLIRD